MKEIINWLSGKTPTSIIVILLVILLSIYLLVCIYKDLDVLGAMLKKILGVGSFLLKRHRKKCRNKFYKEVCDKDYIIWQKQVMHIIYAPLIDECRKKDINIKFTELQIGRKLTEYESVTIFDERDKLLTYPFDGLFPKIELERRNDITRPKYELQNFTRKGKRLQKIYFNMMKDNLKHTSRLGYMLEDINFSQGKIDSVCAYSGCYKDNVEQSHVMDFELYRLYKHSSKKMRNRLISGEFTGEDLLSRLEIRNCIHKSFTNEYEILTSGKYRTSLIGVQIFVMVKNCNGRYQVLRIRRSQNVAAKAGYLQFIPSGGFECCNDDSDFDAQWSNYSLPKILFKELTEECFGQDDDEKGKRISPEKIYFNNKVKYLIGLLDKGEARFEFLGTVMSLTGLRQEFSFILKIDDSDFIKDLLCNNESHSAINLIDIRQLESDRFWTCEFEQSNTDFANDFDMLNCTSAALFELARKSKLYQQALNEGRDAS